MVEGKKSLFDREIFFGLTVETIFLLIPLDLVRRKTLIRINIVVALDFLHRFTMSVVHVAFDPKTR